MDPIGFEKLLGLIDMIVSVGLPRARDSVVAQLLIVWYAWNWPKERITVEPRTLFA